MRKAYTRRIFQRFIIPLLLIGIFYVSIRAYSIWGKGYSLGDMDWNKDGSTSVEELLRTSDVGVREIQQEGETCKEYFDYKDGLPIKSFCSKYSGSDYWFYKLVSKKFEKQDIGNSMVSVRYLYKDNWKAFRIKKEKIEEYQNIYDGYNRALSYYRDILDNPHPGYRYRKKKKSIIPPVAQRVRKRIAQLSGGGKAGWTIPSYTFSQMEAWKEVIIESWRYSDCFNALVGEIPPAWYWRYVIIEKSIVVVKNKDKYGYLCLRLTPESPGFVIKADKTQGFEAKSDGYKKLLRESITSLIQNQGYFNNNKKSGKEINFSDKDYEALMKDPEGGILKFFHEEYEALSTEDPSEIQVFYNEKFDIVLKRQEIRDVRQKFRDAIQKIIQNLTILTGMDFKNSKEWLAWYKNNKDRLVLSEEKGHLIVKP